MFLRSSFVAIAILLTSNYIFGQTIKPDEKTSYFISLSNINSRADVIFLEELIQPKKGVVYFMAERFPVRCFMLKTKKPITQEEFASWIPKNKYQIKSFGYGVSGKEKAYLIYKSTNHRFNKKRP
jgi:hypothetical protein